MRRHTVPEGVAPISLHRYLSRAFPCLPGWVIRGTLKNKDVRVNGVKSNANALVASGSELAIYIDDRYFEAPLTVIYEDNGLLVVEKPSGVPVDIDQQNIGADTMLTRIQAHTPNAQLCHRLDAGTGGILICAKNDKTYAQMTAAFKHHDLIKKYQCLVVGYPSVSEAKLTGFLVKDSASAHVRIVSSPSENALPIETHYRLINSKDGLSLLEVTLITGRTHQIRAHLSSISLPILGDDKYGDRSANRRFGRSQPALWCSEIRWQEHIFISNPPFSF